jgi:non-ribosomal peptide synthetase component F
VLQKTAEDFIKSLPHQYCGLANIQRSLDLGNSPLFNTILSFHRDDDVPELNASGIAIKSLKAHDPTEYALSLDVGLFKSTLAVTMQFWTDHLTREQVRSIASALDKALSTIVHHPDIDIGEAELVSQSHIDKMLEFNGNGEPLPTSNRLVFTDIEKNARIQPQAEAICAWDGSWTYKDLDDVTTRLGHYLRSVGVGPEIIVPYVFYKSAWAAIAMISITKAGGAFVGLDPTHPRHRLENLVADVNATVICVSPETADLVKEMDRVKKLVVIDADFARRLPAKDGPPCPEVRPYNLSCVVFSSGTTAKPKTIALEHSSMSTMADLLGPPFKLDQNSRVFQFAAYPYDVSNHDVLVTLQRGGCVCIPSEDERINDPGSAIQRLRANWAALTTTVLKLLHPERVPSLKFISCGGEPMDRDTVETWAGVGDLVNGMTTQLIASLPLILCARY